MRTTLTIDDDIAVKLNKEMRQSGKSFKETVNEFLRIGLHARRTLRQADAFKVNPHDMGTLPGLDYDSIGDLLERTEGPAHR